MQEHREGALGYFILSFVIFVKKSAGPLGLKNTGGKGSNLKSEINKNENRWRHGGCFKLFFIFN